VRGERLLLRCGECLVYWACCLLPSEVREDRYQEWVTELPEILNDPTVKFTAARAITMLVYAADQARGTVSLARLLRAASSRSSTGLRRGLAYVAVASLSGVAGSGLAVVVNSHGNVAFKLAVLGTVVMLPSLIVAFIVLRAWVRRLR
jgi:hypothetical protein